MRQTKVSRRRRGNFAAIFMLALPVMFGFGAMSVDVSYMQLSRSQAQDVADAASQAALIVLRATQDQGLAQQAALRVAQRNDVAGGQPDLELVEFGTWDTTQSNPTFQPGGDSPNAVRVRSARANGNSVEHLLGKFLGRDTFQVRGRATSATRHMNVVLVVDVTNSWEPSDFDNARQAAARFLEVVRAGAGPFDKIGMTVFTYRYGWELTPLTALADDAAIDVVQAQWNGLRKANRPGDGSTWPTDRCIFDWGPWANNRSLDWYSLTGGGCYPDMPREFNDEWGTDHTTGITMARTMFEEEDNASAFRAMVVLTDGYPEDLNTIGQMYYVWVYNGSYWTQVGFPFGETRNGYSDDPSAGGRFREYAGPVPHAVGDIRAESVTLSEQLWDDLRVHTYVVSFVADDPFMTDMAQGQGYYVLTNDSDSLVPIFEDIANSLPLAIVE